MSQLPSFAQLSNLSLLEEMYTRYQSDPALVESSWRYFFEGVDFSGGLRKEGASPSALQVACLIDAYRRFGHLEAEINPLSDQKEVAEALKLENLGFKSEDLNRSFPTLGLLEEKEAPLKTIIAALRKLYCGSLGFEYMDTGSKALEEWIQSQIEPTWQISFSNEEKIKLAKLLDQAEAFEAFLHIKYPGQTRFSLEGMETLIPLLKDLVDQAAAHGMQEFVMGMAHRGRLNVLAHVLQKPYPVLFHEFEDTIELESEESSDVKYHKGYSTNLTTEAGAPFHITLSPNSSCLESTDGVVLGQTKAKQVVEPDFHKIGAILIHGDAALAGQGVVYETLQMQKIKGFSTGGTLHIVLNNQIGYTTLPHEGRSTRYCTDVAKGFGCPVIHANVEDPEACLFAMRLCLQIRLKFGLDVFLDLNGYRKYGHNEGDEPIYTQPCEYAKIRKKKSIAALYGEKVSYNSEKEELKEVLTKAFEQGKHEIKLKMTDRFGQLKEGFDQLKPSSVFDPLQTGVPLASLKQVIHSYTQLPVGFHLHPKLQKWLEDRAFELDKGAINWGTAECLAFGTLAFEGKPIRLTGQDVVRGTFSQRHAGFFDQETGAYYSPYAHFGEKSASIEVYNSILSEYGALSFEFGYSWSCPIGLTLWEAQYGDFVIGGQIPIDHYLVSAEQKWNRYSNLVMLLPHGYEGAGPEHSSGRIERFLELSALNNIQVVYPTTPAQYFHLLRRQALRKLRKPLVVFTPKGLLRSPSVISSLTAFTDGQFEEILDDPAPPKLVQRLFVCSGRIYYDLVEAKNRFPDVAIIRIEQIYPLHTEKWSSILRRYPNIKECIWVQEEPQNMGAYEHLAFQLQKLLEKIPLRYVGRARSGATATGSKRKHKEELAAIFRALETPLL